MARKNGRPSTETPRKRTYRVELKPAAERDLAAFPREVQEKVVDRLAALAEEPRPPGAVKLQGIENTYRIRVGDYRILYSVHDDVLLVLVLTIGNRRDVYKRFSKR
ncbi:MAG: type II toxin-antitoxin system RelE/ParE family toxin [Thermoanaerobaculia bacterium]|nr:type II toxin-antitoxin system RelE/ParE family toxin [Thermoanaerobaculia bacterium]